MRSSGLSIFQISKEIIVFGLLISFLVFWISDRFVPQALATTQRIRAQVTEGSKKIKDKQPETINNLSLYGLKNRLFFINKFHTATSTMEGVIILEQDEHQNLMKKIVANKGIYQDGLWRFSQSITYDFDLNGQIIHEPQYMEEEIMSIPETPKDFVNQRQRTDNMSIAQMEDYIWKLSRSGANSVIRSLNVDLYVRYASPFRNVIIIILGIPFSLIMRRRATGISSIGICILVGFLYYILDAVCIAFGKGGILPPVIAASLSHVIALTFGTYLIASMP
jgi:lipopolysaccharide export system permease protein